MVDQPEVKVRVWRGDAEQTLEVPTAALSGSDLDRIVLWAGARCRRRIGDERAARHRAGGRVCRVFLLWLARDALWAVARRRIVEVDGLPTPDLDAFLKAVAGRPDRASVRLRTVTWNNAPEVITLKLDRHTGRPPRSCGRPAAGTGARSSSDAPDRIGAMVSSCVRASQDELEAAVEALRDGELVAFPTETVYGLGANANNPAAVRKIFEPRAGRRRIR